MQFGQLKRRELIALLGGAVAAWPAAARAQQPAMPVIGFLNARSPEDTMRLVAAFRRGLGAGGFVEGQSVIIEYRWALGQYDRLAGVAAEFTSFPLWCSPPAGGGGLARCATPQRWVSRSA